MTTPADRDPVATAKGLTDALKGMAAELKRLSDYGRRSRHLILFTLISLALDVALTVVVGLLAVQSHDATVTAQRASASNLALCQAGNTARAQNRQLTLTRRATVIRKVLPRWRLEHSAWCLATSEPARSMRFAKPLRRRPAAVRSRVPPSSACSH